MGGVQYVKKEGFTRKTLQRTTTPNATIPSPKPKLNSPSNKRQERDNLCQFPIGQWNHQCKARNHTMHLTPCNPNIWPKRFQTFPSNSQCNSRLEEDYSYSQHIIHIGGDIQVGEPPLNFVQSVDRIIVHRREKVNMLWNQPAQSWIHNSSSNIDSLFFKCNTPNLSSFQS